MSVRTISNVMGYKIVSSLPPKMTLKLKLILARNENGSYRSSQPRFSVKKGILKNFANLTMESRFNRFNKFAGQKVYYKETPERVFSCEICETFRNTYCEEHLLTTLLVLVISLSKTLYDKCKNEKRM